MSVVYPHYKYVWKTLICLYMESRKNGEPSCREGIERRECGHGWWGKRCVGANWENSIDISTLFFFLPSGNTNVVMGRNFKNYQL